MSDAGSRVSGWYDPSDSTAASSTVAYARRHVPRRRRPRPRYGASRKIAGQPLWAYTMTANTIASKSRCTTST